jgi:multiple sugar transport system substrate-binding protein
MYNSKIYGYPYSYATELLFYRKDLFSDPAIQSDFLSRYKIELAPPQDWFSYNLIARYFTHAFNPSSPVAYGTSICPYDTVCNDLYSRMWAYGGKVFDRQGRVCLYSDENIRAYSNFAESLLYADASQGSALACLSGGNAAMTVTFCSFAPEIFNRAHSSVVGRVGFAPVPSGHSITSGWILGLNRYGAHTDDARRFMRWFVRDETAMAYTILGGCSAYRDIYKFNEIRQACPWMDLAFKMFPNCRQRTSIIRDDAPPVDPMKVESILSSPALRQRGTGAPIDECLRVAHQELCAYLEESGFPQPDNSAYPPLIHAN